MFLSANASLYGSNTRVYTNFTCQYSYSSSLYDCTNQARLANDSAECVESNAVLQCFRPCEYISVFFSSKFKEMSNYARIFICFSGVVL